MSVQIHFHFFLRRQKVIGHFIFFPKKFQERTPPESGSEEWWIFGQVHFHRSTISAQFAESSQASSHVTEFTDPRIPGPIILQPVPAVSYSGYVDFSDGRFCPSEIVRRQSRSYIPGLTLIIRYGNGCIRGVVLCGAIQISFFSADCKIYCPWHLTNWLPRNIIIITIYRKY